MALPANHADVMNSFHGKSDEGNVTPKLEAITTESSDINNNAIAKKKSSSTSIGKISTVLLLVHEVG